MSHLTLVADNHNIAHPFTTRRERDAKRGQLGIVAHSGGRMLPVPLSVYDNTRRALTPAPDYVQAPCDVE